MADLGREHPAVTIGDLLVSWYPRQWWGGLPGGSPLDPGQIVGWVLHHTVMRYNGAGLPAIRDYMRRLQDARPDLGGRVPYTVAVFPGMHDGHGIAVEGRGLYRTGAHTAGLNSTRHAWAIAGDARTDEVSPGMIAAMRWVAAAATPWAHAPTIGHKDAPPYWSNGTNLNATACPGTPHGTSAVPQLQPPFTLDPTQTPPPDPAPDPETIVHYFRDTTSNTEWVMTAEGVNHFPGPDALRALRNADVIPKAPTNVSGPAVDQLWATFGLPPHLRP